MSRSIRIGTRSSELAMWQTNFVKKLIADKFPEVKIEIIKIKTTGDKILDKPLSKIGVSGLFTKELENALMENRIDVAVHSLKDMESELPEGLKLGAVPVREDPRDVLISDKYTSISGIPENGRIFTGSLRRKAQLLNKNPFYNVEDIRGNVGTRLNKYKESSADGLIIAAAGMKRLGLGDKITYYIDIDEILPAVGQGALGIEIRKDDDEVSDICGKINNPELSVLAKAERRFLKEMSGGCRVPIAGHAVIEDDLILIKGMIASTDGKELVRDTIESKINDAENAGKELAIKILDSGGRKILNDFLKKDLKDNG